MAVNGVKTRPTLEQLQAELRAIDARLDAVHDRANSMERAARLLLSSLAEVIGCQARLPQDMVDRMKRAVQYAAEVGVP